MKQLKLTLIIVLALGCLCLLAVQASRADTTGKAAPPVRDSIQVSLTDSVAVADSLTAQVAVIAKHTRRLSTLLVLSLITQLALLAGLVYFLFVGAKKLKIKQAPWEPNKPKGTIPGTPGKREPFNWDGK